MKSWERIAGIVTTLMAVLSLYGAYSLLPYRVDQTEKASVANAQLIKEEAAALRSEMAADRAKATESKEILIRMEERLKNLQGTVETLARNQRFGSGTRQEYGKQEN